MNWGYKILCVYIIFMAGIVTLVVMSSSLKQDLVADDYYEQELKYQDKIDQSARAAKLSASLRYEINLHTIELYFPEGANAELTAQVLVYNIANQANDVKLDLSCSNAHITFTVPESTKGWNELRITWTINNISYYYQNKIFIT